MGWLRRTAVPLVMAGLMARRYAGLRGPVLWLAVMRGLGVRAAIPVLLLLALGRWATRPRARAGVASAAGRRRPDTAANR